MVATPEVIFAASLVFKLFILVESVISGV